ncbi:MAG: 3-hydroxyacyl-CoA dehydrogenase NAD-binding domain-containing protein [Blastocatellia bacterium]
MTIETVGVIGAGIMGTGLAQSLAQTGHRVILIDISDDVLSRARQSIRQSVRFHAMLNPGQEKPDTKQVLERIEFSTNLQLLEKAEFVIENVTEKWAIKKKVYSEIDAICAKDVVFAANTSAIPITRIASATTRASQVIGMHFMNPVPLKDMVEVITGYHTNEATIEKAKELLQGMGKEFIIVKDSPGFVSNRVLMLMINEAIFLVEEGVAPAEEVDRVFKTCFGHKMGPLETADLIGLDTILLSIEVLYESFNDSKYRPCPLLRQMVDAGLGGRKSGRGFYSYQ